MKLKEELNVEAQRCAYYYAKRGKIDHTCRTAWAGENLYSVWVPKGGFVDTESGSMKSACKGWYNEIKTYNFTHPKASTGKTGHFTQLIWKGSTSLGVGIATVNGYTAVVGKYNPPGNVIYLGRNTDTYKFYKKNVVPFPPPKKVKPKPINTNETTTEKDELDNIDEFDDNDQEKDDRSSVSCVIPIRIYVLLISISLPIYSL